MNCWRTFHLKNYQKINVTYIIFNFVYQSNRFETLLKSLCFEIFYFLQPFTDFLFKAFFLFYVCSCSCLCVMLCELAHLFFVFSVIVSSFLSFQQMPVPQGTEGNARIWIVSESYRCICSHQQCRIGQKAGHSPCWGHCYLNSASRPSTDKYGILKKGLKSLILKCWSLIKS